MYAASARSSAPRSRKRKRRLEVWIVADVRCNVENCKYSAKTLKKVEEHRQLVHNLRPNVYKFQSNSTTSFEPESLKDGGLDPTTSAKSNNVKCKLCTKSKDSETSDTAIAKSPRRRKRKRAEVEKKEVEDDEETGRGAGKAQGKKEVREKEERKNKEEEDKILKGQKAKHEREKKKGKRRLNGIREREQENTGAMADSDTMDVDHDPAQASPTLKSKQTIKRPKQQLPLDMGSDQTKAAVSEESAKTSNQTLLPSPTLAPVNVQTYIESPSHVMPPWAIMMPTPAVPKTTNLNSNSPDSQLLPPCANQSIKQSKPKSRSRLPLGGRAQSHGTLGGEYALPLKMNRRPYIQFNGCHLGPFMVRKPCEYNCNTKEEMLDHLTSELTFTRAKIEQIKGKPGAGWAIGPLIKREEVLYEEYVYLRDTSEKCMAKDL